MRLSYSFALLLFLALTPTHVLAVCNSGELGIGVTTKYEQEGEDTIFVAVVPEFYDNDCNAVAVSSASGQSNFCEGSYGPGAGIQCTNGVPTFVWTPDGNYHNCYALSNGACAEGPFTYTSVYWCCQYWP